MSIALTHTATLNRSFKTSAEAILILDSKGTIIKNNPASEELLGVDIGVLLKKNLFDIVSLSKIKDQRRLMDFVRGKDADTLMIDGLEYQHGNGDTIPIRLKLHLVIEGGDRQILVFIENANCIEKYKPRSLFVANNVAKQKQIETELQLAIHTIDKRCRELDASLQRLIGSNLLFEQQLQETRAIEAEARKNQRLFAAIADNFPRGIICVINNKLEYEYLDGEIMKQLKIDPKRFIGKHMDEIAGIDKKRHRLFKEDIDRTFAGEHLNFEVKFDHQIFSVNTTPLIEGDGEIKRILFVYNNITHQKQIEKKIRKSLKKEHQLNTLKSQFISTASHEFRTPLSAILSSADLIGAQNNPGQEGWRSKHLDKIKSNVQRLVVILDEFLSISQLEAKKVMVKPEYFNLVPFSKYLLRELKPNLKPGQRIISEFDNPEIPVQIDPKLLDHILRNLLINAIKFSGDGSKITFILGCREDMIFFEISDSGIGISPMDQKQIFQQFFRAGNATNIQGTGLGLHLVKQYVALMKGNISLKSEVDKGTTFYLEFHSGM